MRAGILRMVDFPFYRPTRCLTTEKPPMSADPLTERLIHLEGVIAHLQHDFDQLHSVLLAQQAEIDRLKTLLAKVESRIDETETAPEKRDPQSERPPHY